jgi:hypothetical protein
MPQCAPQNNNKQIFKMFSIYTGVTLTTRSAEIDLSSRCIILDKLQTINN